MSSSGYPTRYLLAKVGGSISVVSTLCVIVSISRHKGVLNLRRELIRYVAFFDCLVGLTAVIGEQAFQREWLCHLENFFISGVVTSVLLTLSMTHYNLYRLYGHSEEQAQRFKPWYLVFAIGYPFLHGIVNSVVGAVGPAGAWCWIGMTYENYELMRLTQSFVLMWVCLFSNILINIWLGVKMYRIRKFVMQNQHEESPQFKWFHIVRTTFMYALAEIITWVPSFVLRVLGPSPTGFAVVSFLIPAVGFLSAVVYFAFDTPRINRRAKWDVLVFLTRPDAYRIFHNFAKCSCTHELLDFWTEVEQLRVTQTPVLVTRIRVIYQIYVKPGAEQEINISYNLRKKCTQMVQSYAGSAPTDEINKTDLDILFQIQKVVISLITRGSYYHFILSEEFNNFTSIAHTCTDTNIELVGGISVLNSPQIKSLAAPEEKKVYENSVARQLGDSTSTPAGLHQLSVLGSASKDGYQSEDSCSLSIPNSTDSTDSTVEEKENTGSYVRFLSP